MTKDFNISEVRGALARGYCHLPNRRKELDSNLLEAQAEEIMNLVEECAEEPVLVEGISGEALVSPGLTPEEIRVIAYELVIKNGQGGWSDFHKKAGEIAERILNGFTEEAAVKAKEPHVEHLTIKLDIDSKGLDAEIERRARLIRHQGDILERQSATIRRQQDTISAQREILDANKPILAGIFSRIDYRREGWNDAKAVMIRALTRQIKAPTADSYILDKKSTLQQVRDFVASFQFDETKP